MKKKSYILLLVLLFSLLLSGCISKAKPEDTIYKMEEAINEYDMKKLVECFEPSIQKIYKGILTTGQSFANTVDGIVNFIEENVLEDELLTVDITVNSKERISAKKVKLNITFTIDYVGQKQAKTMDVTMVYIKGEWYISSGTDIMEFLYPKGFKSF